MNKIIQSIRIAAVETVQDAVSIKGLTILLTMAFFMRYQLDGILSFADRYDCPIEAVMLPYLHQDGVYSLIFAMLAIYYYSDAPYLGKGAFYQLMRLGRVRWAAVKLLRILFGAVLIMGTELLLSMVVSLPHIEITGSWGKVWNTLTVTNTLEIGFARNIVILFTPFEAQLRVFLMGVLILSLMGVCQFVLSLYGSRNIACVVLGVISCGPVIAYNSYWAFIYFFSPVAWIGIIEHSRVYPYRGPGVVYMIGFLAALLAGLVVTALLKIRSANLYDS